jgi:hypothetical protein
MATRTGGKKELEAYLLEICRQACENVTNGFYETVNYFLAQYYSEDWDSRQYQRTEALLHSCFKTEVKKKGNGYYAEVYINYEALDEYKDATGFQVVSWANTKGIHGGLDVSSIGADTAVWDDSIDTAINSGMLFKDCIVYLKSKGYNIIA